MDIVNSTKVRYMNSEDGWVLRLDFNLTYKKFRSMKDAIEFVVDFIEPRSKVWPVGEERYEVQTY